jgi:hypothetical protein
VICLTDTDIVIKLASCDLLSEFLAAFGVIKQEVYILPELRFKLRDAALQQQHGRAAITRANQFALSVRIIPAPDPEEQHLLNEVEGIDSGEQVLFSATRLFEDFIVVTGDKYCLPLLATDLGCESIYNRVKGRIVCFEQVILRIIQSAGFNHILRKSYPRFGFDRTLQRIFQAGLQARMADVENALQAEIESLRKNTFDLLREDANI